KKAVDSGLLGRPVLADARVKWYRPPEYYSNSRWRGTQALDGGGALINQGIHTADLLLWMFGDVASVQAHRKAAIHNIEVEDTLVALIEFKNGAMGVLQACTSVYPGYPRRLELTGTEGTITIEQDRLLAADLRKSADELSRKSDADQNPSSFSPVVSDVRGHQAVLEDFIRVVENGGTPQCDGVEGRRSVALVEAIYEACKTGKRVSCTN